MKISGNLCSLWSLGLPAIYTYICRGSSLVPSPGVVTLYPIWKTCRPEASAKAFTIPPGMRSQLYSIGWPTFMPNLWIILPTESGPVEPIGTWQPGPKSWTIFKIQTYTPSLPLLIPGYSIAPFKHSSMAMPSWPIFVLLRTTQLWPPWTFNMLGKDVEWRMLPTLSVAA